MAKLKEEEIVEQWGTLIEGAQGRQKEFFETIKARLNELEPPKLDVSQEKICPSLIRKLKGESRIFMVIKNKYFDGYILHVGAENYGKQLNLSWYLTQRPSKFMQFMASMPGLVALFLYPIYLVVMFYDLITKRRISLENMDMFDKDELSAFAGTIHHAVLYSSKAIADSVGFDFSRVDQKSRGFLNLT